MKKSPRRLSSDRSSLSYRLAAYSVAAGAAIAAAPGAHATITKILGSDITYQDNPVGPSNPATFGLAAASNYHNFFIAGDPLRNYFVGKHNAGVGGFASLGAGMAFTSSVGAIKFALNAPITVSGSLQHFASSGGVGLFHKQISPAASMGNFGPGHGTGYVGFHFINAAKTYYGWLKAQLLFDGNGLPTTINLLTNAEGVYGAYELKTDGIIRAGQTAAVPEPSMTGLAGLGLLALGAAGVREMRRRKKAVLPAQ